MYITTCIDKEPIHDLLTKGRIKLKMVAYLGTMNLRTYYSWHPQTKERHHRYEIRTQLHIQS